MLGELEGITGHHITREMLSRAIAKKRLHHALLFQGAAGIGKYLTAISLARALLCQRGDSVACGQCSSCRRLSSQLPFHPDLHILKDLNTPLYLNWDLIASLIESGQEEIGPRRATLIETIRQHLKNMLEKGFLSQFKIISIATPAVDCIQFSPDHLFSGRDAESLQTDHIAAWLIKRFSGFQRMGYWGSIKIENMRMLQKELDYQPFESNCKLTIIDDAENMLDAAQNSFLKTLEEPPGNALILLITSNPSGLYKTIRSRCQPVPFYPLAKEDIADTLVKKFGYKFQLAQLAADAAEGRMTLGLQVDPEAKAVRDAVFSNIFVHNTISSAEWAVRATLAVWGDQEDEEVKSSRLVSFMLFVHERLKDSVSNETIPEMWGPCGRRMNTNDWQHLADGLTGVFKVLKFSPDIQLQLEAMFVRCFTVSESGYFSCER